MPNVKKITAIYQMFPVVILDSYISLLMLISSYKPTRLCTQYISLFDNFC